MARYMTLTPSDPFTGVPIGEPRRIEVPVVRHIADTPGDVDDATPLPPGTAPVAAQLEFVGTDPDRAKAVLARELGYTSPRKSLVTKLGALIAPETEGAGYDAPDDRGDEAEGPVSDTSETTSPEAPA